jgi:hypothetical protein
LIIKEAGKATIQIKNPKIYQAAKLRPLFFAMFAGIKAISAAMTRINIISMTLSFKVEPKTSEWEEL